MGGMEDYYIAQFFCWREIILLNLEIDIETASLELCGEPCVCRLCFKLYHGPEPPR